jgi:hypothetical protein
MKTPFRKRLRLIPLWLLLCAVSLFAQTKPDISRYTSGQLPTSRLNAPGVAGLCLQTDGNGGVSIATCAAGGGGGGYATIQNAASAITQRAIINWVNNITCADNSGATRSDCDLKSTISTAIMNATTGFQVNGVAGAGKVLIGDGTNFVPGDPLVQGLFADGSTSVGNPVAIGGYDTSGTPAIHRATFINGTPGGTEYALVTRNIPSGTQPVSGSVSVSNLPATQAISAVSLPLPTGAATSANQPALVSGRVPVDPSGVTSPISAASLPLPTGAAQDATLTGGTTKAINRGGAKGSTTAADVTSTASGANHQALDVAQYDASGNQLGLSASPVRTDPTGTSTQPVSAASLPLPTGAATSANQATVKAASTQAAASDTSEVVQLNPNQPQLTTPLNTQGGKTNNNAAPGATNFGTLPAIANAAPPSWTEGNQVNNSQDLGGNTRVYNHPPAVLGCYQVNGRTSTYAGLAAGAPLFSYRWGDATRIAIINHVKVNVMTTVAATTAGQAEREMIVARGFSASDTGGTAVTLTGNNQKMRTSQGTSLVTDMRFGTTITAGTRTLDANPIASAIAWLPLNMTGVDIGCNGAGPTGAVWSCVSSSGYIDLLNTANGQDYPLVLVQNEGFIVRVGKDAMPAGATQQTYLTVSWCEANAYIWSSATYLLHPQSCRYKN